MKQFEVRSYYDVKFRGLEDSLKTDNIEDAIEFTYTKIMQGNYVEVNNLKNGNYTRFNYDDDDAMLSEYIYEDVVIAINEIL